MSEGAGGERRSKMLQVASAAVFLVVIAVGVLVVVNSSRTSGGDTDLEDVGAVNRQLSGIPQRGMLLGDPAAPMTLVEFGDLKCPHCADYSEGIVSEVIGSEVRPGRAAIDFRNFTVIDDQSKPAGAAALAAGEQGRGWNFLEIFYRNQGDESQAYADDAFLTAVARAAGVADIARWNRERRSVRLLALVERTSDQARDLGFSGTPSFAFVTRRGGLQGLGTPDSAQALEAAVDFVAD
jgi:protein-disulfide isomerase